MFLVQKSMIYSHRHLDAVRIGANANELDGNKGELSMLEAKSDGGREPREIERTLRRDPLCSVHYKAILLAILQACISRDVSDNACLSARARC